MNMKYIHSLVKNPKLAIVALLSTSLFNWVPDEVWLKIVYWCRTGMKLDLDNPTRFNEKLQWLKLHDRNPKYTQYVDKYAVREYIKKVIGEEYLVPLIGVWDNVDDIDFSSLPEKYVLKCTHDSGGVVLVDNNTNLKKAKGKIKRCLKANYYARGREWAYKGVKPRVIAEKYIDSGNDKPLTDYKFMCFDGVPKIVFTCTNRNNMGCNVTFFDINWNRLPFERHYQSESKIIPKPANYDKMLEIATKLSQEIPFVRVDLYSVGEQIFFGELTLYPGCGFEEFRPDEYDEKVGRLINCI